MWGVMEMYEKGQVRDILYELIVHLECLQLDADEGDILMNDLENFYASCIDEVELYIEEFEE